jgi:hypothetical protein
MKNKFHYIAFALLLSLTACEKVIDLDLRNDTGKLVIEGNIVDTLGVQTIKLTTNVPFSNTNTYPPVTGAQVSVSDQAGNSYSFSESQSGMYTSTPFKGIAGNTYTMTALINGKTYTASSTMPTRVPLDSLSSRKHPIDGGNNKLISVHYQDPAGIVNQYRFTMYLNNVQIPRVFANDDEFSDGRNVNFDFRLGNDDPDIHAGDKVTVEMQCVDKTIYTYWFSFMQQSDSGPGGAVAPSNPPNNIKPVTLGYFSAHTTQTKTIIVK